MDLDEAVEAAERWAIFDPDPRMRSAIDALVDERDARLIDLFDGRIGFGTAGLRAAVAPGPKRMNALVVRQTTAAVVSWLQAQRVAVPKVVIGFDARADSQNFALHAAAAVEATGGEALLGSSAAPTPVIARAVLDESADAGVVITASHNPAQDNGYKLYLGDGIQLVSPTDAEIAGRIDEVASGWSAVGSAVDDTYAAMAAGNGPAVERSQRWASNHRSHAVAALSSIHRDVGVAYTAMHGVGGMPVVEAFRAGGFADPVIVEEQFEPDAAFPTVPFPNPEEAGAMDHVIALALAEQADAAFANDPDADRLAVALPDRHGESFVALSGNELGILLADHVISHTSGADRIVARSVVSSRQLDAVARAAGVRCEVTLTGFKWVARPIVDIPDHRFVFGFEEAIGYCVGDRVRDKDGITAALVAAEMLAGFKAQGITVWDRLDALASVHGVYANQPVTVRFDDNPDQVAELMQAVATAPPTSLAGSPVTDSGPVGLGALPATPGLHLLTADRTQVIIRPSGTEPKLKAYIEVIEPVTSSNSSSADATTAVAAARMTADARLAIAVTDVQTLLKTNL